MTLCQRIGRFLMADAPKFMGEKLLANWKNVTLAVVAIVLLVGVKSCFEHHSGPKTIVVQQTSSTTGTGVQLPFGVTPNPEVNSIPVKPAYIDTSSEGLHVPHGLTNPFKVIFKSFLPHGKKCIGGGPYGTIVTLQPAGTEGDESKGIQGDTIFVRIPEGKTIATYQPSPFPAPGDDTAVIRAFNPNDPTQYLTPEKVNPEWATKGYVGIKNTTNAPVAFACAYAYLPANAHSDDQYIVQKDQ
jgi:hypothetical protein